MSAANQKLLVVGYGSLLSGCGLLTVRRAGKSRLVADEAFPVLLRNARRGLAKPSSHGRYFAMDLEPATAGTPITGRAGCQQSAGEIGAIGLLFDRRWAEMIARREEYSPHKFLQLIELADRANQPLGEFLLRIKERVGFNLLDYRRTLFEMLGYTSPGYVFHPLPLDDGRVALVAIGSGFEGSGDPQTISKRSEYGIARLLKLDEAIAFNGFELDRAGQLGYFIECVLGGLHGIPVADLLEGIAAAAPLRIELARLLTELAADERAHFTTATSLSAERYAALFAAERDGKLAAFLDYPQPE